MDLVRGKLFSTLEVNILQVQLYMSQISAILHTRGPNVSVLSPQTHPCLRGLFSLENHANNLECTVISGQWLSLE